MPINKLLVINSACISNYFNLVKSNWKFTWRMGETIWQRLNKISLDLQVFRQKIDRVVCKQFLAQKQMEIIGNHQWLFWEGCTVNNFVSRYQARPNIRGVFWFSFSLFYCSFYFNQIVLQRYSLVWSECSKFLKLFRQ